MSFEIKAWLLGVIAALLMLLAGTAGVLYYHNQQIKAELATEKQKVEDYKHNKEGKVKAAANMFLNAYMELDSSEHKTTEARIKPYTTPEARKKVVPPGEGEIVSKTKITSEISNTRLYYSSLAPNKASIFAKTNRSISVNDEEPTKTKEMIELQLQLIKGKWIVTDIEVLSEYDNEDLEDA